MKKPIALAAVAAGALVGAPAAQAHVTLQPKEIEAGSFARVSVRVPNEEDTADTTKVRVQFPSGFLSVSYEPVAGWTTKVTKRKLAEPVEQFGEKVTEEVSEVSFTAAKGKGISPGQFRDFGLSMKLPEEAGSAITFKALQTYDNGEVVRWIGPPDADKPAPQVTLLAAAPEGEDAATAPATASAATTTDDDGPSTGLVIAALVLGALGLLAGGAALLTGKRASAG